MWLWTTSVALKNGKGAHRYAATAQQHACGSSKAPSRKIQALQELAHLSHEILSMMRKRIYIPVLMMAAMLCACHSPKEKMFDKAQENLKASLDYPKQLKLIAHTEPDSAYGVNYFTRKEITGMLKVMDVVTKKLMKSTTGINNITKADAYTVNLMRRQMNAANEVQTMIFKNVPKGDWSGWKVKIDYECVDKDGIKYRAERWIFFDREGENIIKTFEIPLP